MTKSKLAAQKCEDSTKEVAARLGTETWFTKATFLSFYPVGVSYREFREHVSDLCEQAISSGDTSGLEELVLRDDADLLEAREIVAKDADAAGLKRLSQSVRAGRRDTELPVRLVLTALRRGREIERGEGM